MTSMWPLHAEWNRFVPEYNAVMASRRKRNVCRPLAASDAQRETVLKLRKRAA